MLKLKKFRKNTRSDQKYKIMAVLEVLEVLAIQAVSILITETLVTKWKDLGNQRETLGDQRERPW